MHFISDYINYKMYIVVYGGNHFTINYAMLCANYISIKKKIKEDKHSAVVQCFLNFSEIQPMV